jgi:uncharacterized protein (DUF1778 family)
MAKRKIKKRMGRPPSDNPKRNVIMVKLTDDERARIEHAAAAAGLTLSAYLRREDQVA